MAVKITRKTEPQPIKRIELGGAVFAWQGNFKYSDKIAIGNTEAKSCLFETVGARAFAEALIEFCDQIEAEKE